MIATVLPSIMMISFTAMITLIASATMRRPIWRRIFVGVAAGEAALALFLVYIAI